MTMALRRGREANVRCLKVEAHGEQRLPKLCNDIAPDQVAKLSRSPWVLGERPLIPAVKFFESFPGLNLELTGTKLLDEKLLGGPQGIKTMAVSGRTAGRARCLRVEAYDKQLLPGIPDDITLDLITPRLDRWTFHVLPLVSQSWLYAMRSHQVYHARVRSELRETLALIKFSPAPNVQAIALYSIRENVFLELPPVPHLARGIPKSCECVAMDGKVYVLGGVFRSEIDDLREVYVLDLAAGQGQWNQCASMQEPREDYGCGAIDGKIYIFGGTCPDSRVPVYLTDEVYDPEEDTWSQIERTPSLRFNHTVTRLGEELFLHGGNVFTDEYMNWVREWIDSGKDLSEMLMLEEDDEDEDFDKIQDAHFLEVYNPIDDVWRVVENFQKTVLQGPMFIAQGKFYSICCRGIEVHDMESNSWTLLQSQSFAALGPVNSLIVIPMAVLAVDNELLATVLWYNLIEHTGGTCLLRSRGLGSGSGALVWQKAGVSLSYQPSLSHRDYFIHPIQL